MPKRIDFEGQVHEFPDDFTDEDIAAALESMAMPAAASKGMMAPSRADETRNPGQNIDEFLEGAAGRVIDAGKNLPGMVANAVSLPFKTAYGMVTDPVNTVTGAAETVGSYPGMIWEGVKGTVGDALSGDPARMGSASVDIAASAAPTYGAGKVASVPAKALGRASGRALRSPLVGGALKTVDAASSVAALASGNPSRLLRPNAAGMLEKMRGMIADKLDPPRLVKPVYKQVDDIPADLPAVPPAGISGRPLPPVPLRLQNEVPVMERFKDAYVVPEGARRAPARASGAGPRGSAPAPGDMELFNALSQKVSSGLATPAEIQTFEILKTRFQSQASNKGLGYAAK